MLPGADALISAEVFTGADRGGRIPCDLILTTGAGINGIDFAAVPERTSVCNVFGHERGIAEYVFTTMSMLNRDYPAWIAACARETGATVGDSQLPELQVKTVAIVGTGTHRRGSSPLGEISCG